MQRRIAYALVLAALFAAFALCGLDVINSSNRFGSGISTTAEVPSTGFPAEAIESQDIKYQEASIKQSASKERVPLDLQGRQSQSAQPPAESLPLEEMVAIEDWAKERLYPTEAEFGRSTLYGTDLPLPPDLIPRTTQELYDSAQMAFDSTGREDDARTALLNAATNGAVYGLVAMGQALQASRPVESEGYYRAAQLLGDWSVVFRPGHTLNVVQDRTATLYGFHIVNVLNERRSAQGLPPLVPIVRPGVDAALAELIEYSQSPWDE